MLPDDVLQFFKKNCHCPERFLVTFERIWNSLDTAVGGSWSVGHHLALAWYVVVLAGQRRVVGHQAMLGGHVLRRVRAVWLRVVTLQGEEQHDYLVICAAAYLAANLDPLAHRKCKGHF